MFNPYQLLDVIDPRPGDYAYSVPGQLLLVLYVLIGLLLLSGIIFVIVFFSVRAAKRKKAKKAEAEAAEATEE